MAFQSILFQTTQPFVPDEWVAAPEFFIDLNLDQIVAAVTAGKEEYDLKPFFNFALHDIDTIIYRHEVMRALETNPVFEAIGAFAKGMRAMRQHLVQSGKLYYRRQKERWFLDAVESYCDALVRLVSDLSSAELTSRGLIALREYATQYAASERFTSLIKQTKGILADLSSIKYAVMINSPHVRVRKYEDESDYSADVEATFERFKQGSVKGYQFKLIESPDMNHVEARVLELVSLLYPEIFGALQAFCTTNKDFSDPVIVRFDREIHFYVAYLEHIARFKKAGLNFCYPCIIDTHKEIDSLQGFDLALAGKLLGEGAIPVCNDFCLKDRERIIVVSGPNQGGKTTFARTVGQLHYLACLGCPVPGQDAQLFLFDKLLTHFEREEEIENLRGKLQDDLFRIHDVLKRATPNSIIIMNEIFTSTTLQDAVFLSKKVANRIMALDLLCVWVTFIDEMASLSEQTVSMVSTVVPGKTARRSYKIVRRPSDGLSYAVSIAQKYRLTYDMIKERIGS